MVSDAKNVTDYLKEVPENRKEALTKLRKLCKEILIGYKESMACGGPGKSHLHIFFSSTGNA